MKKNIIPFLLLILAAGGVMAGPKSSPSSPDAKSWAFGYAEGVADANRFHSVWVSEVLGEDPRIIITKGGAFDNPPTLNDILNRIEETNKRGMTYAQFNGYVKEMTYFLKENPRYRMQTYIQLGNLYNYVHPHTLRNTDRAFQFYNLVLPMVSSSTDKAQIYLLMASCFNSIGSGEGNISELTNYLMKAAEIDGRYASGIGDIVMCGWGNFCDLYLAASFYTIGMQNGDAGSAAKMYILKYIIEHPNWTTDDSLGIFDFERYLYHSRLTNDDDRAFASLISACQRGFIPAYYYAAYNYINNDKISIEERRKNMFRWLSKGSQAGYAPCVYGLGKIAETYTIDTAKGDIYKPDTLGNYSEADKKACAKQAFELYQRAANMGSTNAMLELADRYKTGNPYGYPKQDNDKALYYYILCTNFGNSTGIKRIEEMRRDATNTEEFDNKFELAKKQNSNLRTKIESQQQHIFEQILNSTRFQNPMMVATSYNMAHPDIDITNNHDQLLLALLAQNYNNVYKLYMDKMARFSRYEKSYTEGHASFFQERMRELRLRFQSLNLPKEIRESMWESWDGE